VIRATSSGDFLVYASDDIFAIVNNTLASRVIVLIKNYKSSMLVWVVTAVLQSHRYENRFRQTSPKSFNSIRFGYLINLPLVR